MPAIEFLADRREGGNTIATVLRKRFQVPWGRVKKLIEGGHVRVAGFACTDPALRVRFKNRVWIREGTLEVKHAPTPAAKGKVPVKGVRSAAKKPAKSARPPEPLPLAVVIVFSDAAVVVVDKPAGLTTMRHEEEAAEFGARGRTYLPKTLADHLPALLGEPGAKLFPVHRIDRDTSGLVAFARTPAAASSLTDQFRKHTVDRQYLALVRGEPADGRIESVLVRDRGDGRRGTGEDEDGKRAVTQVKVLERFVGFGLVECRLETGRTHQVRIHLGEAGTPMCGERLYDRPAGGKPVPDTSGARRPLLHAARLGFVHPDTGVTMAWDSRPPGDFAELWARLRREAKAVPPAVTASPPPAQP